MSAYYKKTIYLDLVHCSSGEWDLTEPERIGNAGFAKIEMRDGNLSVHIQVRVVQAVLPAGFKEIRLLKQDGTYNLLGMAEYSGGGLRFRSGSSRFELRKPRGICIPLSELYRITGRLADTAVRPAPPPEKPQPAPPELHAAELSEPTPGGAADGGRDEPQDEPQNEPQNEPQDEPRSESQPEFIPYTRTGEFGGSAAPNPTAVKPELPGGAPPQPEPLPPWEAQKDLAPQQSKWQHLKERFEQVHPFQDSRLYLSIKPADFSVLSEEDFLLRNNSFLLHGFHNYRHLILGIMPDSTGKQEYYIGVPGLFYEKEKKMAILFGFEGFESRTSRPEEGTFGYYMKRVRI